MSRAAFLAISALASLGILATAASGYGIRRNVVSHDRSDTQIPIGIKARLRSRSYTELVRIASKLRATGVSIVREDVPWSTIEPKPGRYYWDSMDRWMSAAAKNELQVMAVLDSPPTWATPNWNVPPTKGKQLSWFAKFSRNVVARYGSRGTFWQSHPNLPMDPIQYWDIWNEPYVSRFWGQAPPDPAAYARMFKGVVRTARTADPSAKFMLEADTRVVSSGWPWKPFLAAMFDAVPNLAKYAYGISVHPYQGDGGSPLSCTPDERYPGMRARWQATALQFCRLTDIHRILESHNAGDLKIWITEVGWSTAPEAEGGVSEATQARYVHQVFDLLRTKYRGLISGLIWYEYQGPESDPAELDEYLGLVRSDGTPKPAWQAFREETSSGLIAARWQDASFAR